MSEDGLRIESLPRAVPLGTREPKTSILPAVVAVLMVGRYPCKKPS